MKQPAQLIFYALTEAELLAWNNSWGFEPTQQQQAFYLRMLGAMQVRWIGHSFRSSVMFGPGFPDHPCWETMAGDLAAHRDLL